MMQIALVDQNDFLLEAALDDITYFLRFSWNSEAQIWVMGVQNARNELVLQGVALVPNVALLGQFRTLSLPRGEFVVYAADPLEVLDRASFTSGRAVLYYLTEAEYAAL